MSHCESGELFAMLHFHTGDVDEIKNLIHEKLTQSKDGSYLCSLIDYYMNTDLPRCHEVLIGIREPQEKQLFDKLQSNLKGANRLKTITLLTHIAYKQPPWMYRLLHHPIFTTLIKIMKHDVDMIILMSGTILIVTLFPIAPSLMATCFMWDMCEIFTRLATLHLKTKNISEVIMMHLNVAVYGLFQRIYSLFPCNFFHYLKNYCGNSSEHLKVFDEIIRPMFEHVKVHPMLITHTKETESLLARWIRMETHDIVAECFKLSIDPNDGLREDPNSSEPLASNLKEIRYLTEGGKPVSIYKTSAESPVVAPDLQFLSKDSILYKASLKSEFVSPSLLCGLDTPPPHSSPDFETLPLSDSEDKKREAGIKHEKVEVAVKVQMGETTIKSGDRSVSPQSKLQIIPSCKPTECSSLVFYSKSDVFYETKTEKYDAGDAEVADIFEKGSSNYEAFGQSSHRGSVNRGGRGSAQWPQSPIFEHIQDAQRGRSFSQGKRIARRGTIEPSCRRDSFISRSNSMPNLLSSIQSRNMESVEIEISGCDERRLPITHILNAALRPRSTSLRAQAVSYPSPLYKQLTPVEIQDQYLQLCATKFNIKAGLVGSQSQSSSCRPITHTSGICEPVTEVNVLMHEIQMLHMQLLYERNRREIHAERNRRLMGKAKQANALEVQNNAMKEQLRQMETEMSSISKAMSRSFHDKVLEIDEKNLEIAVLLKDRSEALEEKNRLEKLVAELQKEILSEKEENRKMKKTAEHLQHELFDNVAELNIIQKQVAENTCLQSEVESLKKDLLQMRELHIKYKSQVQEMNNKSDSTAIMVETLFRTSEDETNKNRSIIASKCSQLDYTKGKMIDLENRLRKKDAVLLELKKTLEKCKLDYDKKIKVVEEKYVNQEKDCVRLQNDLFKLNSESLNLAYSKETVTDSWDHAQAFQAIHGTEWSRYDSDIEEGMMAESVDEKESRSSKVSKGLGKRSQKKEDKKQTDDRRILDPSTSYAASNELLPRKEWDKDIKPNQT